MLIQLNFVLTFTSQQIQDKNEQIKVDYLVYLLSSRNSEQ